MVCQQVGDYLSVASTRDSCIDSIEIEVKEGLEEVLAARRGERKRVAIGLNRGHCRPVSTSAPRNHRHSLLLDIPISFGWLGREKQERRRKFVN